MNQENLNKLKHNSPKFLSRLDHIECGDGWFTILNLLFKTIELHIDYTIPEELRPHIYAVQIKEKYATLRIYCNQQTPFIEGAIAAVEAISSNICELCGESGKFRSLNNFQTLCNSCLASKISK